MNEESDPVEQRIIDAVQRQLKEFGTEIADRFAELQQFAASETDARTALEARVEELTAELANTEPAPHGVDDELRSAVEGVQDRFERLDERIGVRVGELADAAEQDRAEAAATVARLEDRASGFEERIEVRVGELADAEEQRVADLAVTVAQLEDRATALEEESQSTEPDIASMVERADAAVNSLTERIARFDEDRVAMDARLDRLDRRRNEAVERLDAVEERLGGIDEIVGEATVGIGDRVEQLAAAHETMAKQTTDEIAAIRAEIAETDADAIDELQDRVSSALGQAELVRIEMDRFQEKMKNDLDANVSRLTAIETAVQDQRMDVESAVQLERLEEVERMVLMLDPEVMAQRSTDSDADDESAENGAPDVTGATGLGTVRTDQPRLPRLAPSTEP